MRAVSERGVRGEHAEHVPSDRTFRKASSDRDVLRHFGVAVMRRHFAALVFDDKGSSHVLVFPNHQFYVYRPWFLVANERDRLLLLCGLHHHR